MIKKILLFICLLSTITYSKIINVSEQQYNIKQYDFSKVNNNDFIQIKEIDGTIYIINKKYITNIKIYNNNSIYIEFFGSSEYNCRSVKLHQDSYDIIYKFLVQK